MEAGMLVLDTDVYLRTAWVLGLATEGHFLWFDLGFGVDHGPKIQVWKA